jgi:Ca2+-binding EF-hand superfamily protein
VVSGINGTGGSMYLEQIRQVATNLPGTGGSTPINTAKAQYASKTRDLSLDKVFAKIDTDGDGVVSKEEFDRAKSDTAGKISEALTNLKTGSTASLVSLLESTNQTGAATGAGGAGTTQSGSLSSDEVFGKMDTNSDGVITRSEFESVRSALQSNGASQSVAAGVSAQSSAAGSTQGTSSTASLLTAQQKATASIASQNKALMQHVASQYQQLAQAGQISGATSQYMFTG